MRPFASFPTAMVKIGMIKLLSMLWMSSPPLFFIVWMSLRPLLILSPIIGLMFLIFLPGSEPSFTRIGSPSPPRVASMTKRMGYKRTVSEAVIA